MAVAAAALLLLVVAGAAVSRTGDDSASTSPEIADTVAGAAGRAPQVAGDGAAKARDLPATGLPTGPAGPAGPRIVRNAELSVEVGKGRFSTAFDRVASIAASSDGYVTASSTATTGDGGRARSGQVTVRVPVDRFEEVRRALGQLGTVEQETQRGEDVTAQLVDYEARLRSLRAQEESLRGLLARAGGVGEVLQVQTALFDVRQQIEQLDAQRTQLEQAASLATIHVSLYEPGAALVPDEPTPGLANSFERAVDGAVAVVGGMIVVVGWLLPLAVLGLLGLGVRRLRRRPATTSAPAPATS